MEILFLTDNFPPERNASASRIYEQALYWVEAGCKVSVLTGAPNFPEGKLFPHYQNKWHQTEIIDGIIVYRIKTFIARNKGFLLRSIDYASYLIPAVIAGCFCKKKNIIVSNCPTPFAALAGLIISYVHKAPFVLQVSDLWPASIVAVGAMRHNWAINYLEKLELFLYKKADKIIVLTHSFKKNLVERGISPHKITAILNGVDLNRFKPHLRNQMLADQYNLSKDCLVAGYIGTFGMAHALENIILAAELLKDEKNIRFILVGTGAEREKLQLLIEKKSLDNVRLIESQPKEKIINFWSLCNIALVHLKNSPVFSEVIPSKIFEAMAMGIPIFISAPHGEAASLIIQEKVGLVLPPENPKILAETLVFYQNNRQKLEEFSQNCLKAVDTYSRERQALESLKVFNGVHQENYAKTSG